MADTKLAACPFCGESRDLVYHSLSSCISCTACSTEGPCEGGKDAAAAAWNTRVLTPKQEAADEMAKDIEEARLHLANYVRRAMWGTDGDSDVTKAQEALNAALTKAGQL